MCGAGLGVEAHLVSVVREVHLVEDLGGFVLDGLHLHQVWRVLPRPISEIQGEGGGEACPWVHQDGDQTKQEDQCVQPWAQLCGLPEP